MSVELSKVIFEKILLLAIKGLKTNLNLLVKMSFNFISLFVFSFYCSLYRLLDLKHVSTTRWLANPNQGRSHFPCNFWNLTCLIHCQREYLCIP